MTCIEILVWTCYTVFTLVCTLYACNAYAAADGHYMAPCLEHAAVTSSAMLGSTHCAFGFIFIDHMHCRATGG